MLSIAILFIVMLSRLDACAIWLEYSAIFLVSFVSNCVISLQTLSTRLAKEVITMDDRTYSRPLCLCRNHSVLCSV
jgi:hypothetical protein